MTIPTQVLGRTGAEVSALGYGAMELRGQLTGPASQLSGPAITNEDAGRLLNEVLDAGVNLIDTSVDYGRSEELIGRHLSSRRSEFFLASKCGCPVSLPPDAVTIGQHDYSAANVRADVEQSLRRLQTDHLDLVQVHLSPPRGEMEASGTIEALQSLRAEGKVRFIGMSGTLPNLPDHIAMGVFDVFQIPYSALQPEHDELITRAADAGAGVLIRGGVARGTASEDKNWTVQPLSSSGPPAQDRWQAAKLDELLDDGMTATSSSCASRSATRGCRARSSAPATLSTCAATWRRHRAGHYRKTSTPRQGAGSPQRNRPHTLPRASAGAAEAVGRTDRHLEGRQVKGHKGRAAA